MAQYEIAGLRVEMDTFGRTLAQAAAYIAKKPGRADLEIRCDAGSILEQNPHLETLDLAEYLATGAFFAKYLLRFQGFQLHASAVELEGKAYLFSAPSGTGKSTHTEKWCRLFGARYLNDDKPAIRYTDGRWMVYGTPWSGKYDLSRPEGVVLGGIAYLERSGENRILRQMPEEAVPLLFSQCVRTLTTEQMEQMLHLADRLLREIPFYHLWCKNEDESALLSKEAMVL